MIEKPQLNETELQQNYEEFIHCVETSFTGDRREKLLKLYSPEQYGMTALMSPASVCEHFHLAQPGGYLIHIMHVIKLSFGCKKLFEMAGAVIDFTDEEMVFAAMHHDLGKLGDLEQGEYYVQQDQDWKSRKGELYKLNPNIQYMEVTDRAVFILQKNHIEMNWKEYLGIKLADGMYNEAAERYLKQYNPDHYLRTNLPRVIHQADYTSCRAEYDQWYYRDVKGEVGLV